jgi:hypothetical protein
VAISVMGVTLPLGSFLNSSQQDAWEGDTDERRCLWYPKSDSSTKVLSLPMLPPPSC